ncbi:MAG: alpha/beta hydrolase [Steroidobacteraceae bacterium]|jgi:pimeloyl-ACP methyl ester carboxylesterase|nr:alpha/beta hydrolase [Steroidobacteraceae bacterium]
MRTHTRRSLLGKTIAATAASATLGSATASAAATTGAGAIPRAHEENAAPIVLVHGTWHGGWAWGRVRRLLSAAGHEVHAPSCTGCGDRAHLLTPDVGLDTHVQDICGLIEAEELQRVVLVGHSFAGVTITGVADRLRERIGHLVYFDALVPTRERPAAVMRRPDGSWPDSWEKRRAKFIDGYKMDFFAEYPLEMLVPNEDVANQAWLKRRLTPHPARGWTDPVSFANGGYEGLPKTIVRCTAQTFSPSSREMAGPALTAAPKTASGAPDPWNLVELPTPRDAMITHPRETAIMLANIARGVRA